MQSNFDISTTAGNFREYRISLRKPVHPIRSQKPLPVYTQRETQLNDRRFGEPSMRKRPYRKPAPIPTKTTRTYTTTLI